MDYRNKLYPRFCNPLLFEPERPLPKEVAIIGAGTIGPDIGYFLKSALPQIKLFLVDVIEEPLKNAEKRFQGYIDKAVKRKKMAEEKRKGVLENIVYTMDYSAIKNCDLVIEAATENVDLKRTIFEKIEGIVSEQAILTSNTSSIPADRIFSVLENPKRATITHFFAPAWRNPAVEIITWEKVEKEIVDYLCWLFCKTGKAPVVSDNAICFILDRIFDNWTNDAAYLLDTATAGQVDKVAEEFVAAGPFFVLNLANGNPITFEANTLQMEEGEHYQPAIIFKSVDRWETIKRGAPLEVPEKTRKIVRDRLLGTLFSQSFDIINRGIGLPEDLNLGCQLALGFKPGLEKPFAYYQGFKRHVLADVVEGVKVITIRRPQFMNALNEEVNNEILAAIEEDGKNPEIKGFVITGYGDRAFCAGAEIGKFPETLGNADAAAQYARDCSNLLAYIDTSEKPIVAAVNGMALGGGLEIAIRCHSMVATSNALFQFPEITLGILPGTGGCIVPYRKWPTASKTFHEMIRFGKALNVQEAESIGMVKKSADDYPSMIKAAIEEVKNLQGNVTRIPDGEVSIEAIQPVENPVAGKLPLSREALSITERVIEEAAAARTFQEALEIGYKGSGEIACTDAAKEGIGAFQEKRQPDFKR
jgi:enoyl-CoA hydratase/3-hydroxyacyl-CoA dehydrogenase